MGVTVFEVGVTVGFSAAHRLRGEFGPASRLHGHSYRVTVTVSGERLDESGALYDAGELRRLVGQLCNQLDYRDLDALEPPLAGNTTAERLAEFFVERLAPQLAGSGLHEVAATVRESEDVHASLRRALA